MSKIVDVALAEITSGQAPLAVFEGLTDGLNRRLRNSMPTAVVVTGTGVIVAWTKLGFGSRFEKSLDGDTTLAATFVFKVATRSAIRAIPATSGC